MKSEHTEKIARIDNAFILNAQYRMTAKEQKVLYFLISQLNPKEETEFNTVTILLRDLEETLNQDGTKWGSLYDEISRICESMISKSITFPSNFIVEGRALKGYINWFQSIMPVLNEHKQMCLEFSFSPKMKPFLLQLNQYVRIGVLEVAQMQNTHAIRMFSIFKSEKDRAFHSESVKLSYTFEELKAILGIADKYNSGDLKDFRNRVLNKIRDEINANASTMYITYDYVKEGRKVTGVVFTVHNKIAGAPQLQKPKTGKKDGLEKAVKSKVDKIDASLLPRAKSMAFQMLTKFGIYEGIVINQILPTIKGSEVIGYEDVFVQHALQYFEANANNAHTPEQKAATFVNWWLEHKVFEQGATWATILEGVLEYKKKIQKTNPEAFDNRRLAATVSNDTFEKLIGHKKGK
jgi:plasmid replication initiation protein